MQPRDPGNARPSVEGSSCQPRLGSPAAPRAHAVRDAPTFTRESDGSPRREAKQRRGRARKVGPHPAASTAPRRTVPGRGEGGAQREGVRAQKVADGGASACLAQPSPTAAQAWQSRGPAPPHHHLLRAPCPCSPRAAAARQARRTRRRRRWRRGASFVSGLPSRARSARSPSAPRTPVRAGRGRGLRGLPAARLLHAL